MDAVPHGRATALGLPLAAPRDGEVGLVAVPEGLAYRDQRAAEHARLEQPTEMRRGGAGALLEDDRELLSGRGGRRPHLVEFIE